MPLFQRMLKRCKLTEDETILVVSDPDSNQEYVAAMFAAARSFGADAMSLMLPPPPPEQAVFIRTGNISSTIVANSKKALEFLKMADFVIDMTSVGLLHTKEQVAVLEAGTRMLMVHDPVEVLERLFPTDEDKERIQRHGQAPARGQAASSAVRQRHRGVVRQDRRPVIEQWGWTDEPGRWDHWPGAFAVHLADRGPGRGRDRARPRRHLVPAEALPGHPGEDDLREGRRGQDRGRLDARMIREYIEGWQDPEGYMISHIGFGGHRRGLWNAMMFQDPLDIIGQDGRTAWGTTLFALGSNVTFGGTHTTGCHQDFALKQQRFYLDDELVADSGEVSPITSSSWHEVGPVQLRAPGLGAGGAARSSTSMPGGARVLAGGQSLAPMLQMRLMQLDALIDINRLAGPRRGAAAGAVTVFGPLVRYATIETAAAGRRAAAAAAVRGRATSAIRQVRNRGTIGGSLAQADPTGEMPLACLALDATSSPPASAGTREIPIDDFLVSAYATALEPEEMITEIRFPIAPRPVRVS